MRSQILEDPEIHTDRYCSCIYIARDVCKYRNRSVMNHKFIVSMYIYTWVSKKHICICTVALNRNNRFKEVFDGGDGIGVRG